MVFSTTVADISWFLYFPSDICQSGVIELFYCSGFCGSTGYLLGGGN